MGVRAAGASSCAASPRRPSPSTASPGSSARGIVPPGGALVVSPRARPPRGAGTNRGETDEPATTGDDQGSRPPVAAASRALRDAARRGRSRRVRPSRRPRPDVLPNRAHRRRRRARVLRVPRTAPVPSRTRAAVPALRSACARMCVVLVSALIIDVLRHALNAVVGRCAFGTQPWSDAPPVGAIGAALVDGLNVASSFAGTNARRLIDRPIGRGGRVWGHEHPSAPRWAPRGVRRVALGIRLFSVCGDLFFNFLCVGN